MSTATYAFVLESNDDWRIADDWAFEVVELRGNEKILGHRQIDGSNCKVLLTPDGQYIAISK